MSYGELNNKLVIKFRPLYRIFLKLSVKKLKKVFNKDETYHMKEVTCPTTPPPFNRQLPPQRTKTCISSTTLLTHSIWQKPPKLSYDNSWVEG